MKKQLQYYGHVNESGALHVHRRDQFKRDVAALFKGHDVEVHLMPRKKKRSLAYNSYYWAVVVGMIRDRLLELGNEFKLEEVHDYLKSRFNHKEIVDESTGEVMHIPLSTTNLTTVEFMEYLERIKRWAAETLDIVIPEPGQQAELIFN